ncbi:MAG: carboxypeptidase regulatory-like protein, partial [Bryobacterales bacterium]|nr:carboxypeptidase regulatory-like protein [Bryobacterales bacterium]
WKLEDNWYVHRGGGLVLYPTVPTAGTIVFSTMRQGGLLGKGRIQWVAGCTNDKNYVLFGIDKKNIHRQEISDGKKQKETSESLKTGAVKDLAYTMKIDISSESIVTSVQQGGTWVVVDTWPASGLNPANGKFGFYLPGTDEILLSNFSFSPK